MKKKLILMGVAAALVVTTIISGTLAATTYKSYAGEETANITTQNLSLSLYEDQPVASRSNSMVIAEDLLPGQTIEQNRIIQNTGNYDFYVRATIYKKWDAASDNEDEERNLHAGNLSIEPGSDWIQFYGQGDDNGEQIVLYYKYPVKAMTTPMDQTTSFIKEISLSPDAGNDYANESISLDVRIDAVQADVGTEAIATIWGVFPTISATGEISAISEDSGMIE